MNAICNICGKTIDFYESNDSYPINYFHDDYSIANGCCPSCNKYVKMCRNFKLYFPVETKELFDKKLNLKEVIDICDRFNSKINTLSKLRADADFCKFYEAHSCEITMESFSNLIEWIGLENRASDQNWKGSSADKLVLQAESGAMGFFDDELALYYYKVEFYVLKTTVHDSIEWKSSQQIKNIHSKGIPCRGAYTVKETDDFFIPELQHKSIKPEKAYYKFGGNKSEQYLLLEPFGLKEV